MMKGQDGVDGCAKSSRTELDGLLICVMVLIVSFAFLPAIGNGWVDWDDDRNLYRNPHLDGSVWPGIRWCWTTYRLGVYQPLAWMFFQWEFALGGLSPAIYHGSSVALHILNTVVLYGFVIAVIRRCPSACHVLNTHELRIAAALSAILFAVHPLRVEVVAWASCQPYLFCSLFVMASLLAYFRAQDASRSYRRFWLRVSLAAFVAALLSKAPAVVLPLILVVLDVYPLGRLRVRPTYWLKRDFRELWTEKLPFFILSFVFSYLAIDARMEATRSLPRTGLLSIPFRALSIGHAIVLCAVNVLQPTGLSAIYIPTADRMRSIACGIVVAVFLLVMFSLRSRFPALFAILIIYFITLCPSLVLMLLGGPLAADRTSYIASISFAPMVAYVVSSHANRLGGSVFLAKCLVAMVIVFLLIPMTWKQCKTWRSSTTLWTQVVAHGGAHGIQAHLYLGDALMREGSVNRAIEVYQQAEKLSTDYRLRHPFDPATESLSGRISSRLGHALEISNRFEEAILAYRSAVGCQAAALRVSSNQQEYRSLLAIDRASLKRTQEKAVAGLNR